MAGTPFPVTAISYGACLVLDARWVLYIPFLHLIFAETFEVFCYPHFLVEEQ